VVITAEVVLAAEMAGDHALVAEAAIATMTVQKCTRRLVQNVETVAKFLSVQTESVQCFVAYVTSKTLVLVTLVHSVIRLPSKIATTVVKIVEVTVVEIVTQHLALAWKRLEYLQNLQRS
jgi:hypothetical protein